MRPQSSRSLTNWYVDPPLWIGAPRALTKYHFQSGMSLAFGPYMDQLMARYPDNNYPHLFPKRRVYVAPNGTYYELTHNRLQVWANALVRSTICIECPFRPSSCDSSPCYTSITNSLASTSRLHPTQCTSATSRRYSFHRTSRTASSPPPPIHPWQALSIPSSALLLACFRVLSHLRLVWPFPRRTPHLRRQASLGIFLHNLANSTPHTHFQTPSPPDLARRHLSRHLSSSRMVNLRQFLRPRPYPCLRCSRSPTSAPHMVSLVMIAIGWKG